MRRTFLAIFLVGGCVSGPSATVLDAGEIGTLSQSSLITGRDGAESALVWGQMVWTFGDTFLSVSNAEGENFVSNTFATSLPVVDFGVTLADRLDDAGAPNMLLQPTADEQAFDDAHRALPDGGCSEMPCGGRFATWPGAMVFEPSEPGEPGGSDGGAALIFYSLESAAPGNFNFQGLGESIAVWSDFSTLPQRPLPAACPGSSPTLLFCADEPGFGAAAVVVDGGLFAFGCVQAGFDFHCELASVPVSQALTKNAWTFWTGSAWSPNLSDATTVFDGASILGVFFDDHLGLWMTVYSGPSSNNVMFRTAPALTGPWSGQGVLFVASQGDAGGTTYDALPHPELSEQDGRILYVTYSRPTSLFGSEFALVRVELQ